MINYIPTEKHWLDMFAQYSFYKVVEKFPIQQIKRRKLRNEVNTNDVLYMLMSFIFIGMIVILESRPVYAHFYKKFLFSRIGGIEVYICYALIIILSLLATFIPMILGIKALKEMEL